ncbi:MAG: site-specific integrase [Bacilli bacterium]|jgi:integrase|nr:site-specific integrase [Bacilli bacterium]
MSFYEAYSEYLIYAQKRHKKQGFETLSRDFKLHILPYFKNKLIVDLKKIDIINWETEIYKKNFSNNFNRNLYYEFSAFITYCVYCSYLKENVVLSVEKFKKKIELSKHDFYNIREFRRFRRHLHDYVLKQYFNFIYFYGPRPGEAMALRFIRLRGKNVDIFENIHRHGSRELDTPKNQSSIRTIKVNYLMRFRFWRLKMIYKRKYGFVSDYFVFGGKKPLSPTSIDRAKKKACEEANIRPITQHQFRHSYATRMIHKKVPIDYVSKTMGHSTVSMTVDVYLHQEKRETRSLNSLNF